jgi:anti-anti-sigma factor
MKTSFKKLGDTIIVSLEGHLDFENQLPLKENLSRLMDQIEKTGRATDSTPSKIIFNLEHLEFVGSCGISSFVQTLKDINSRAAFRPRYCHVKSEFQRIIKAFDEGNEFEFFETEDRARHSFDN